MLQQMYSVYDEKAEAYLTPFFMPTDGMAIRAISDALGDPLHQFTMHPEDFSLYRLGNFDDTDGDIQAKKQILTTILELKAQTQNVVDITKGKQK